MWSILSGTLTKANEAAFARKFGITKARSGEKLLKENVEFGKEEKVFLEDGCEDMSGIAAAPTIAEGVEGEVIGVSAITTQA